MLSCSSSRSSSRSRSRSRRYRCYFWVLWYSILFWGCWVWLQDYRRKRQRIGVAVPWQRGAVAVLLALAPLAAWERRQRQGERRLRDKEQCTSTSYYGTPRLPLAAKKTTGDDCCWWGTTCRDGAQSLVAKMVLTANARQSVVASLNYGGGVCFQNWLHVVEERLRMGVVFRIIASGLFMQPTDRTRVLELAERYPRLFFWQWSEPTTEWLAQSGRLSLSSNHVKALVVDEGVAMIVGGCGIQEAYAGSGLPAAAVVAAASSEATAVWLPAQFRDMDWVLGTVDGRTHRVGRQLHFTLLDLWERWSRKTTRAAVAEPPTAFNRTRGLPPVPRYTSPHQQATTHTPHRPPQEPRLLLAEAGFICCPVSMVQSLVTTAGGAALREGASYTAFHEELLRSLTSAHHQIWIAHMFLHWTPPLKRALLAALHRGVHVTLISNTDTSGAPLTHTFYVPRSQQNCQQLWSALPPTWRDKRLRLYEFFHRGCTFHKKVVVIDDQLWFGNSNLGDKSLVLGADDEVNMRVTSAGLAQQTRAVLQRDLQYSTRFHPAAYDATPRSAATKDGWPVKTSQLRQHGRTTMAWLHEHILYRLVG